MSSVTNTDTLSTVAEILCRTGNIKELAPDQDFYDAGITSVAALPLLLEMEDRFQVSIPDDLFIAARTPRAIEQLIASLQAK